MRTIKKVIAFLYTMGIAACFDAIMNNVLETSFIGDGWLDTTCRILTVIGMWAFGWFICAQEIYPYFKKRLGVDEN